MTARLRPTWVPRAARVYRRPGGPWDVPTLDSLISARGGEIVDGDTRLSAAQADALVATVAGGLRERGATKGAAVAWQVPNSVAAAVLARACWRLGAVAAPLLHSFGAAEVEGALAQIDPALVVELGPEVISDPAALADAVGGAPVPAAASGTAQPSDVALVLFTSGSTGVPKAVLHTHRGLSWKASLMARVHGLGPGDAVLMPAPMAHIAGMLNGVLVPGAAGMRATLMRRFDPELALALVGRERISFMAGPPTFFIAMAGALAGSSGQGVDVSSVRLISSGGASVTPAFVEDTAHVFDCRVKRTYGSTEAPTVTTSTNDDPVETARDTDGRAVGDVELRVSHPETGVPLRRGSAGELWVRGPEMFAGYAEPSQTAAVIARGGWFKTGDLATVDADGWLRIVGRLKDVIIRGGENISASEVEAALEAHPDVRHAVAVGYPDPLMGERVAAFVESAAPFGLEECRRWFSSRGIATFKTPEKVVRLERLPLLGSGKADRAALRRQAAGGGGGGGGAANS
ncbi:MAG TPA: class I adenylate-forming enzyme family protein [Acidimicrobiales bacterium]|nr:class I adenylate-forming enzyme family protein [Acidimicrobiales bacterium]